MKDCLKNLELFLVKNNFFEEVKILKKIANENFSEISSLNFAYEKTMPLLNEYSSRKWFQDNNLNPNECIGEGPGVWYDNVFRGSPSWESDKKYDLNNDGTIDEKDEEMYCGPQREAEKEFYENNEFFEKIVNRKTLSPSGTGGLYGTNRDSIADSNVAIYKVTSSPANYFLNSKIAVIYGKSDNPEERLGQFNEVLTKIINDTIKYLNQDGTRKAFKYQNKRSIELRDLLNAFKKLRYIILDPRQIPDGGEAHIDTGVVVVSYNISAEQLLEVLGHEITDHALHGLTRERVTGLTKALDGDAKQNPVDALFYGARKKYTEGDKEFIEDSIQEYYDRDALFKPIPIEEFDYVFQTYEISPKAMTALPRVYSEKIKDYVQETKELLKSENLNSDTIRNSELFKEREKKYNQLVGRRKRVLKRFREKIKYEAEIVKDPIEFEDDDGDKIVIRDPVGLDQNHTWDEWKEYQDLTNNNCHFYDLYVTIFGENHWAMNSAFEQRKDKNGCREINQHFFKHSIDDNHRLGSLRKLYKVLRMYEGDPISKTTIKKAIIFAMPTKFYRDNFDLFRFLVLLKNNNKNINYIYEMQDKVVKIDTNTSDGVPV